MRNWNIKPCKVGNNVLQMIQRSCKDQEGKYAFTKGRGVGFGQAISLL